MLPYRHVLVWDVFSKVLIICYVGFGIIIILNKNKYIVLHKLYLIRTSILGNIRYFVVQKFLNVQIYRYAGLSLSPWFSEITLNYLELFISRIQRLWILQHLKKIKNIVSFILRSEQIQFKRWINKRVA